MGTLRSEQPHMKVICKDSSQWSLPMHERKAFEYAWTQSKAFWWGTDLWGAPVIIKLGDITGMVVLTAEALAAHTEEAEEERARSMLAGDEG